MLSAPSIIILVGLASSAIGLAILAKAKSAKPKKAERGERAQIVKQLLALSEGENSAQGIPRQQSVSQGTIPRHRALPANSSRARAARSAGL